jgi:hypothetical protein
LEAQLVSLPDFHQIIACIRPFSMVPDDALVLTMEATIAAIEAKRPGVLVETGTWMGGASFAMLLAQRHCYGSVAKPVWMFDSFEGLPRAQERDGPAALTWQSETNCPRYYDNCRADLDKVRAVAESLGFTEKEAIIVPGWFHNSLPGKLAMLAERRISVLRIDCDWYEPVRYVLDQLTPAVVDEGVILLDDYFAWDGCARAVHDFLAENDLCYRIRSLPSGSCAWMVKQAYRVLDF